MSPPRSAGTLELDLRIIKTLCAMKYPASKTTLCVARPVRLAVVDEIVILGEKKMPPNRASRLLHGIVACPQSRSPKPFASTSREITRCGSGGHLRWIYRRCSGGTLRNFALGLRTSREFPRHGLWEMPPPPPGDLEPDDLDRPFLLELAVVYCDAE